MELRAGTPELLVLYQFPFSAYPPPCWAGGPCVNLGAVVKPFCKAWALTDRDMLLQSLCEHGGMIAESQEWRHAVADGPRQGYSAVVPQSRQC